MDTKVKASELVSTGEAATILRVSKNTIHKWVKEGRIKAEQKLPSGYLRFSRLEVERLSEEMRVR